MCCPVLACGAEQCAAITAMPAPPGHPWSAIAALQSGSVARVSCTCTLPELAWARVWLAVPAHLLPPPARSERGVARPVTAWVAAAGCCDGAGPAGRLRCAPGAALMLL